MNKFASFHTRLGVVYSLFGAVLVLFFGLTFYIYNSRIYEKNAFKSAMDLSSKISMQLENTIQYMDFISIDCISQPEFVSALRELTLLDRTAERNNQALNNSYLAINNNIIKVSVLRSVSRLSVFNIYGDFFTSHFDTRENRDSILKKIDGLNWINSAREANGGKIIIPPYLDPWADKSPSEVFSLVRMVRDPGNEVGFIEVQTSIEVLEKICHFGNQFNVVLYDNDQNLIYSTFDIDQQMFSYYTNLVSNAKEGAFIQNNLLNNRKEIISHSFSDYLNWTIVIIQDRDMVLQPLTFTRNMMFRVALFLIILSILLSYIIAKKLTHPIRELRDHIEGINIDNLPDNLAFSSEGIDEIESLYRSFQTMRNRLNTTIKQEIKSRSLQLKSHFDSLQAQINPHFIYNMLNIIANMGLETGSEEIADTCRKISAMLRFSTSNVNKKATIMDEINHVSNYLSLMKKRFEHKLEYQLDIDKRILEIEIPKLVLQPLIENAIYHGFENSSNVMKISIKGIISDDYWIIDIIDNGSGFSASVLEDLREKIKAYENEIYYNRDLLGLSIGGMGIINTFARLSLFYNRENKFEFGNIKTGGAFVSIGGKINYNARRDDNSVQSTNCRG